MTWLAAIGAAFAAFGAWIFRAWRKALAENERLEKKNKSVLIQARLAEKVAAVNAANAASVTKAREEHAVSVEAVNLDSLRVEADRGRLEAAGLDADRLVEEANRRLAERQK